MTQTRGAAFSAAIAALAFLTGACGEPHPTSPIASPPNEANATQATLPTFPGAGQFVAVIDNPYYPLIPGTTFEYRAETADGVETNTVEVTSQTKTILGVTATVVHDQVFLEGELTEDTFDWYAQDTEGNVWYLGEQSCEVENGQCVSTAGSWEAGVDGALPGVIVPAEPMVGMDYRQEYLAGQAEDRARILSVNERASTPAGFYRHTVLTAESTALEPRVSEYKFLAPGFGPVLAVSVSGESDREELMHVTMP